MENLMRITNSKLPRTSQLRRLEQKASPDEKSTLFLDLNPFSELTGVLKDGAREAVQFAVGSLPGVGSFRHLGVLATFNSQSRKLAQTGLLLNIAGTVGLGVALAQTAAGGDPTLSLAISAGALGGSGLMNCIND